MIWCCPDTKFGVPDTARVSTTPRPTGLNDNTVHLAGMVLDIPPGPRGRSYRDKRVEVRQLLDRSWRVYLGDGVIATGPATAHGELRAQRRRKHGRGAPSMAPLPPRLIEAAL